MKVSSQFVIAFLICAALFSETPDIPKEKECSLIDIRQSEGLTLGIFPNGSARLSRGVLFPHAECKPGTFNFSQIHNQLKSQVIETNINAEKPYVAVTFFGKNDASARSYYLYNDKLVAQLFEKAQMNSVKIQDPLDKDVIIFVCEHGSAKSVVAAAHFNRLAKENALPFFAVSRGTIPDVEIAPPAARGLRGDGIQLASDKPAKLTPEEASNAVRVVSFCDLPKEIDAKNVERWTVPPVSEDYSKSRDAIVKKLHGLINELSKSQ